MAAYSILVLLSTLYAIILETETGRELGQLPFVTIPIGGAIILACLFPVMAVEQWLGVALAFIVGGIPFMVRALLRYARDSKRAREAWGDGWNDKKAEGATVSRGGETTGG